MSAARNAWVSVQDIADLAEVNPSAVGNWRRRHTTFPAAHRLDDREVFSTTEIMAWLDHRKVRMPDLGATEPPGSTYGMRFRKNLGIEQRTDIAWREALWSGLGPFRGVWEGATLMDITLGLLYLSALEPGLWADLVQAEDHDSAQILFDSALSQDETNLTNLRRAWQSVKNDPDASHHLVRAIHTIDRAVRAPGVEDDRRHTSDVFDFLMTRFATAEDRHRGVFVTPRSLARLLVELTTPAPGDRILDPCAGTGAFLIEVANYLEEHAASASDVHLAAEALQERSWLHVRMGSDIRGLSVDLGERPGVNLTEGHDKRFDVVLANPPFNLKLHSTTDGNRWQFGSPPASNANFAWLQHIWSSLSDGGRAAVLMANAALSSARADERQIRAAMLEEGAVEALIALPSRLFTATAIPVTIWLLTRRSGSPRGEVLFVDAQGLGSMVSRTQRALGREDMQRIVEAVLSWRAGGTERGHHDRPGFSSSVPVEQIREHDYQVSPGMYVVPDIPEATAPDPVDEILRKLEELDDRAAVIDAAALRQLRRITTWTR